MNIDGEGLVTAANGVHVTAGGATVQAGGTSISVCCRVLTGVACV